MLRWIELCLPYYGMQAVFENNLKINYLHCCKKRITILGMKTKQPTVNNSIRLPPSYWVKLRELWKSVGGDWLLKAIDREHKRIFGATK